MHDLKREKIIKIMVRESICNLCGFSCDLSKEKQPEKTSEYRREGGLLDAMVYGNYESTAGNGFGALDDCSSYCFSLCEFCLDFLFQKFVIPVSFDERNGEGKQVFVPAKERVLKDDWRKWKKEFLEEAENRDKARSIK